MTLDWIHSYAQLAEETPDNIIKYIDELDSSETGCDMHFSDDAAGNVIIKRLAERLREALQHA
jgi:hypothetical protein